MFSCSLSVFKIPLALMNLHHSMFDYIFRYPRRTCKPWMKIIRIFTITATDPSLRRPSPALYFLGMPTQLGKS